LLKQRFVKEEVDPAGARTTRRMKKSPARANRWLSRKSPECKLLSIESRWHNEVCGAAIRLVNAAKAASLDPSQGLSESGGAVAFCFACAVVVGVGALGWGLANATSKYYPSNVQYDSGTAILCSRLPKVILSLLNHEKTKQNQKNCKNGCIRFQINHGNTVLI
jgi:hypothetical protein